jgi:hypothetical protein
MLILIAAVAIVLYVSQAQVDYIAASPMTGVQKIKLLMLLVAVLVILFERFGR